MVVCKLPKLEIGVRFPVRAFLVLVEFVAIFSESFPIHWLKCPVTIPFACIVYLSFFVLDASHVAF